MKARTKLFFISLILFLSFSFCIFSRVEPVKAVETDPAVKATNYQIEAHLDTRQNQLDEEVTITVQNNSKQALSQLLIRNMAYGVLRYDRLHYAKFNRDRQTIVNRISQNDQILTYQAGRDKSNLYVNLPEGLAPGKSTQITISVTTDIPDRNDRFGFQKVRGGKIFNLSFCFPYLSDYRNDHWNYHPYSDEGENRNSAISNYKVIFTAPRTYKVAASGQHFTYQGTTNISAPSIRDLAIVASNRFRVSHAEADGIQINNFYVLGENKLNTKNYNRLVKQTAADSLLIFDQRYGHYPYKELDLTEFPFAQDTGGMEYSGLIMLSDEDLLAKRSGNLSDYYDLLQDVSHEVAHQWFFGTVGSDEFEEPWLDEGMAEFSEDFCYGLALTKSRQMFLKITHQPRETRRMAARARAIFNLAIKKASADKKRSFINYPMDQMPTGKNEEDIAYELAETFYAELMVTMGQDKFYRAMKDYCQTYYMKQATGKDFLEIIRHYDNSPAVQQIIHKFISPVYLH